MIVYGLRSFDLEPVGFLADLHTRIASAEAAPPRATLLEWLVDAGEAEAAVADALLPEVDSDAGELSGWREIAGAISAASCASWYGDLDAIPSALQRARWAIERVLQDPQPRLVRARTAEGFACYSLYPEQYMSAAEQILARGRAQSVFCLGLRSIGGILAHVVGASLQRGGVWPVVRSVRPRGHPFDRHLRIDRSLEKLIASSGCDLYAVIDEGPGISGTSFAAAAEALLALGITRERVVLVPAWHADGDRLNAARGRRTWQAHRRFVGEYSPFERYRHSIDLSAGQWRSRVFARAPEWPAVQPQHERPKFLDTAGGRVARFAGIGRTAWRRRERAEVLHDLGFGAAARELRDGVLELEWLEGRPVQEASAAFLHRAAEYVAAVKSRFALARPDDVDELAAMIDANAAEAGLLVDVKTLSSAMVSSGAERVAVDGRMMLHDWIQTGSGFAKVDTLDHHDDDFFPGSRDIAWDVAGMCVECDLSATAAEAFVHHYARASGDRDIGRRLPFYEAAYTAYRLGDAHLASETVAEATDAERFKRLERVYANRLRRFQRSA